MTQAQAHWDGVYNRSAVTEVSWFQAEPTVSVDFIVAANVAPTDPIVDVGGGASTLVDRLLDDGYQDITVVDIALHALTASKARLGPGASSVDWITADVFDWQPGRAYQLWHDRAVFHFLTDATDRARYLASLNRALAPGGHVVIGTFAADGPMQCSGLPTARYDPADLAREFSDFRVDRAAREEHQTPAGHVQPFTWLLLSRTKP